MKSPEGGGSLRSAQVCPPEEKRPRQNDAQRDGEERAREGREGTAGRGLNASFGDGYQSGRLLEGGEKRQGGGCRKGGGSGRVSPPPERKSPAFRRCLRRRLCLAKLERAWHRGWAGSESPPLPWRDAPFAGQRRNSSSRLNLEFGVGGFMDKTGPTLSGQWMDIGIP